MNIAGHLWSREDALPQTSPASTATSEQIDPPLVAKQAAEVVGLSLAAFWRAVSVGRLPRPYYPLPRAPRWFRSDLLAAMQATRELPSRQKDMRRLARLRTTGHVG